MEAVVRAWKTILLWGLALIAVLMVGALIEGAGVSDTCMFILMPYFAALVATVPVVTVQRFGTGICTFLPYALRKRV